MNSCSICKCQHKEKLSLTCDHYICTSCIHYLIFFNQEVFEETKNINKEMELTCIICEKGSLLATKNMILEFIDKDFDEKEKKLICEKCPKGSNQVILFCNTCQIFLCHPCLKIHAPNHIFTNNLEQHLNTYNKCFNHPEEVLNFKCKACSTLICSVCKDGIHLGHEIVNINKIFHNVNEKILQSLSYPTYEEFEFNLDKEREEILTNNKVNREKLSKNLQHLISNLEEILKTFDEDSTKIKENINTQSKILKFSFKRLYYNLNDIEEDDKLNLNLISKFSNKISKIKFQEKEYENLDKINFSIKSFFDKFQNEMKSPQQGGS
jgi:hypothetical protein